MRANAESVRALIAEHFAVDIDAVRDEARFGELGADSLDMVELAMRLEEAFDISIDDDETEACTTVGHALALVREKALIREVA